jgi:hypothetical protein
MVMPRRGYPHHCIDVGDGDVVRYSELVRGFSRRSMEDFPRACLERGRFCGRRRMLVRIAVFLPLSVLAFSLFAIALAIETMRDTGA